MRITDLLKKESIELNSPVSTKQGAMTSLSIYRQRQET